MSGFDEIGIPDSNTLREALTSCTNPLKAIEEFQTENGILLPTLQPALPLLDLHGIRRKDFHQSVMEELRERLLSQTSDLAKANDIVKVEELLDRSFPLIRIPNIRPVVMSLMKHLPRVPDKYLSLFTEDRELYSEAAVEVKRQIWQDNQALFGDEVSPLLSDYVSKKEQILLGTSTASGESGASSQLFFSLTPKTRRQSPIVQKLTNMVGKNIRLYDMTLQFLRTLFLRTRNVHYCTLRAELLMSLHDADISEICNLDPCYKFTWCLDACIREKFVDEKRAKELQGFLDGVRRGQEQVLGDLAMILCDPYAVSTVSLTTLKVMHTLIKTEALPKESSDLMLLLRLLYLGLGAWDMIDSQVFKERKVEHDTVVKFAPFLMSLMVEDYVQNINRKLGGSEPEAASPPTYPALTKHFREAVRKNRATFALLLHHLQNLARFHNKWALAHLLPVLGRGEGGQAFSDLFLHPFFAHLALGSSEEFASEDFCAALFDKFLLGSLSRDNVLCHTLRLLGNVFHRLQPARLAQLMKLLEPTSKSQNAQDLYKSLLEKVEAYNSGHSESTEHLDSPLMSVPTPASL